MIPISSAKAATVQAILQKKLKDVRESSWIEDQTEEWKDTLRITIDNAILAASAKGEYATSVLQKHVYATHPEFTQLSNEVNPPTIGKNKPTPTWVTEVVKDYVAGGYKVSDYWTSDSEGLDLGLSIQVKWDLP